MSVCPGKKTDIRPSCQDPRLTSPCRSAGK